MDYFVFLPLDLFPLIFDHLSFSELIVALFVSKLFGRQARRLFDAKADQVIDEAERYLEFFGPCFGDKFIALNDLFLQGSINVAQWFQEKLHFPLRKLSKDIYSLCGAKGDLEFAKFILKNYTCSQPPKKNHWICPKPGAIAFGAVVGNHIEILYWLRDTLGCNHFVDPSWALSAASYGHTKMARTLIESFGCHLDRYRHAEFAAQYGDLEMLKYVWQTNPNIETNESRGLLCSLAAGAGQLDMLKWLRTNGFHWTWETTASAAENGHMEVLRWAHENGCELHEQATSSTAGRGDLVMLKWLREKGCPWDDDYFCRRAVEGGHLEMLKYAVANGCNVTEKILEYAAEENQLQILIWGREQQRLPWTRAIYRHVRFYEREDFMEYLHANNYPTQFMSAHGPGRLLPAVEKER